MNTFTILLSIGFGHLLSLFPYKSYLFTKDVPKFCYQVLLCLFFNTEICWNAIWDVPTAACCSCFVHRSMNRSVFSQRYDELEVALCLPRLVGQSFPGSEHVEIEIVALRPEIRCSGLLICWAPCCWSYCLWCTVVFPGIIDCSLWRASVSYSVYWSWPSGVERFATDSPSINNACLTHLLLVRDKLWLQNCVFCCQNCVLCVSATPAGSRCFRAISNSQTLAGMFWLLLDLLDLVRIFLMRYLSTAVANVLSMQNLQSW